MKRDICVHYKEYTEPNDFGQCPYCHADLVEGTETSGIVLGIIAIALFLIPNPVILIFSYLVQCTIKGTNYPNYIKKMGRLAKTMCVVSLITLCLVILLMILLAVLVITEPDWLMHYLE